MASARNAGCTDNLSKLSDRTFNSKRLHRREAAFESSRADKDSGYRAPDEHRSRSLAADLDLGL
jgi:hypothetical protein